MSEYAIEVKDLCIQYKSLKKISIKQLFQHIGKKKDNVVEAVKGVSFQLEKGEILGIVGRNGSGKSTTLRAIAGIFAPNSGSVDLHGNSISLLSIGVGFQPALSGRENILLSGLLLGFPEEEIRARMDEIIHFSELDKFIDAPVRTYSSGMYSKLAFSITAILETDIMLIDEVLSVGDPAFRRKSYAKMKELISDKDRTVVIVSHDRKTITDLCTKVLWIDAGKTVRFGPTAEVIPEYDKFMAAHQPPSPWEFATYQVKSVEGASYQWQYRVGPKKAWNPAQVMGSKTAVLRVPMTPGRNGFQYRCKITDPDGRVHFSIVHTLKVDI